MISVGTKFEADNLEELFGSRDSFTDNFNINLKKKSVPECFQDILDFWKLFLNRLE